MSMLSNGEDKQVVQPAHTPKSNLKPAAKITPEPKASCSGINSQSSSKRSAVDEGPSPAQKRQRGRPSKTKT